MSSDAGNLITVSAAERLLRAHDGDCALLYLWFHLSGSQDPEKAAGDLCMTRSQIDAAAEKLRRMFPELAGSAAPPRQGAVSDLPALSPPPAPVKRDPVPLPPDELPEYTAEEITTLSTGDSSFQAVRDLAESLLGKQLNRHDISRLLGLYNHLGLSAEVLFVLLNYCAEVSRGPDGADRKPTINFIERQAYTWVNRGISTMEEAEAYAEQQHAMRANEGRIKRILEIYDRSLTAKEKENIAAWFSMGFSDDAIALAYERMLDSIGKRSLPYMDTILRRWNEAGLHTADEIRMKEPAKKQAAAPAGRKRGQTPPRHFEPTKFE